MMQQTKTKPRVSVVIPVFNEADCITECLQRLKVQSIVPLEIIVVDNGSTDGSGALARESGVTVLIETKQGIIWARNRGFNAARGGIIARLDADTFVEADWLEKLVAPLSESVVATSGATQFYDTALRPLDNWLLRKFYFEWNAKICGVSALFGSSMAIKRTAWEKLKNQPFATKAWEDLDLAARLDNSAKFTISNLPATISIRSARRPLLEVIDYMWNWPRTYVHHRNWRGVAGSLAGLLVLSVFAPIVLVAARRENSN